MFGLTGHWSHSISVERSANRSRFPCRIQTVRFPGSDRLQQWTRCCVWILWYRCVGWMANTSNLMQHKHAGLVTEFRYCERVAAGIDNYADLGIVVNLAAGMARPDRAFVFVDNHDNQRGHGGAGNFTGAQFLLILMTNGSPFQVWSSVSRPRANTSKQWLSLWLCHTASRELCPAMTLTTLIRDLLIMKTLGNLSIPWAWSSQLN